MVEISWFKVDDGFHSSRKLMSIPKRHRLPAAGLWVIAGSWCADQLTDGHVPDYMLKEWGATPATVAALVDAGLWEQTHGTNLFYKWHEYQPSKQDVDAERATSRERMREIRARRKQRKPLDPAADGELFGRTVTERSENVRNPDPTRPDPTHIERPTVSLVAAAASPPRAAKKGSRIPEPFVVTAEMATWARTETPGLDHRTVTARFEDYWRGIPGAKGVKLDWPATWRNWMRKEHDAQTQRAPAKTVEIDQWRTR